MIDRQPTICIGNVTDRSPLQAPAKEVDDLLRQTIGTVRFGDDIESADSINHNTNRKRSIKKFGYYKTAEVCRVSPIRDTILLDLQHSIEGGKVDPQNLPVFRSDLHNSRQEWRKSADDEKPSTSPKHSEGFWDDE